MVSDLKFTQYNSLLGCLLRGHGIPPPTTSRTGTWETPIEGDHMSPATKLRCDIFAFSKVWRWYGNSINM